MTYIQKRWIALSFLVMAPIAMTLGATYYFNGPHRALVHDATEDDPAVQPLIRAAEKAADKELEGVPRRLGFCHQYWAVKKRILKEKHGIDWHSPAELNPNTRFD